MELYCTWVFSKSLSIIIVFLQLIGVLDGILSNLVPDNSNKQLDFQDRNNSDDAKLFIELGLLIDYDLYQNVNNNQEIIKSRYKNVIKEVNSFFQPFGIVIVLTELEICADHDEFKSGDAGNMYRKCLKHADHFAFRIDYLLYITTHYIQNQSPSFMCTNATSCSVEDRPHVNSIIEEAWRWFHVLASSFRKKQDTKEFSPSKDCFVSNIRYEPFQKPQWNNFSKALAANKDSLACLHNKPNKSFEGPECGNSITEIGEQCDCGSQAECDDPCCIATTCMLKLDSCTEGECCDIKNCRPYDSGRQCKPALHQCEYTVYCDGKSIIYPKLDFKNPGENCSNGQECDLKPVCNKTKAICPISDDGICDVHGRCRYNNATFSQCHCPDNPQESSSIPYHLFGRVILLSGGLLILLFIFDIVIRKYRSCNDENPAVVERIPYLSSHITVAGHAPPRDTLYTKPLDSVDTQQNPNTVYDKPIDAVHFNPTSPLPDLPQSTANTVPAGYESQDTYATNPEYAEINYQALKRSTPKQ